MPKGGKREGSGNKAKVPGKPNSIALFTRVSEETAAAVHTLRGNRRTADVVREAIEQWIERNRPT